MDLAADIGVETFMVVGNKVRSEAQREWIAGEFPSIQIAGMSHTATGRIEAVSSQRGRMRITAPKRWVGKLVFYGPVKVQTIDGRVVRLDEGRFDVIFSPEAN